MLVTPSDGIILWPPVLYRSHTVKQIMRYKREIKERTMSAESLHIYIVIRAKMNNTFWLGDGEGERPILTVFHHLSSNKRSLFS